MPELVSIDPAETVTEPTVDINTQAPTNRPVGLQDAAIQAFKINMGIRGLDKSYDQLLSDLAQGREGELRNEIAQKIDMERNAAKTKAIIDYAGKLGRPLRFEEQKTLLEELNRDYVTDPKSVFEEYYSTAYMNGLKEYAAKNPDNFLTKAEDEIPKEITAMFGVGADYMAKMEFAKTIGRQKGEEIKNMSGVSWAFNLGLSFIPGYDDWKFRSTKGNTGFFEGGLLGSHLEARIQNQLKLPYGEFKRQFLETVNDLSSNPLIAMEYIQATLSHSSSQVGVRNAMSLIDVASFIEFPLKTASAIRGYRQTQKAVGDLLKASTEDEVGTTILKAATGDIKESVIEQGTKEFYGGFQGTNDLIKQTADSLPTYLKTMVKDAEANPGHLGNNLLNLLRLNTSRLIEQSTNLFSNILRVGRIDPLVGNQEALRSVADSLIKTEFVGLDNSIMATSKLQYNPISNNYRIDFKIGRNAGELFGNENEAKFFAERFGFPATVEIDQQGLGFYLRAPKFINETDSVVRDAILTTKNTERPDSFSNLYADWVGGSLKTPEDFLSREQSMQRKTAVYAPSAFFRLIKDEAQFIKRLSQGAVESNPRTGQLKYPLFKNATNGRARWKDWKRTIEYAKEALDKEGQKGYFFESPGELDDFYLKSFQRLPDEAETQAYFAYVRMVELDRIFRNITVYGLKARLGTEQHLFSVVGPAGNRVNSPSFEGVVRNKLPLHKDEKLYFAGEDMGDEQIYTLGRMPKDIEKDITDKLKDGRGRLIEILQPEYRPLNGFSEKAGESRIRYVFAENIKTTPLSFEQVPRRGGGHFEYDFKNYIKQAAIRREEMGKDTLGRTISKDFYEGDMTLMGVPNRVMGKDLIKGLEEIREWLSKGNLVKAREALDTHKLPWDFKTVTDWFKPTYIKGVRQSPRFRLDEPFQLVPKDKTIMDVSTDLQKRYPDTFVDASTGSSLFKEAQVKFTGKRDAYDIFSVDNEGTRRNPVYKTAPAPLIDPLVTLDRSLTSAVNSMFMSDYKIFAIENWVESYKHILDATPNDLRANVYYHFYNPKYLSAADAKEVSQAKSAHGAIQQLMGTPDWVDSRLQSIAQRLLDASYSIFPRNAQVVANWALSRVKSPADFLRSVTFHTKLGFFTVPQLWVQMQTYANIMAVSGPKYAVSGAYAAYLNQLTRVNRNPAILDRLDKMASSLRLPGVSGFKPGQFREATEALTRTGFDNVGPEYATLDTAMSPRVFRSAFGNFLDAGTFFFRAGERNVRLGAWYTAYKEFRDKVPTGRLSDQDVRSILDRADFLTVNMSRASNSIMQKGALSVTSQFLTYQMRVAEQFFGKRLGATVDERTMARGRLMMTYAALYGVPTMFGVTGLPIADYIRKTAIDEGYVMGDEYLRTLFHEGIPSVLIALISGQGDLKKGLYVNVGERYGLQGMEQLRDAFRGDIAWYTILSGAAGSTFAQALESIKPFFSFVGAFIRGDSEQFPFVKEDALSVAKELAAVNHTWRTYIAAKTGIWFSKKEAFLESDVSPTAAAFMAAFGFQPQEVSDVFLKSQLVKSQDEIWDEAEKRAILELRRGYRTHEGNIDQAKYHYLRANYILQAAGFPIERYGRVFSNSAKDEALVDKLNWDLYKKSAPVPNAEERIEMLHKQNRAREQRRTP